MVTVDPNLLDDAWLPVSLAGEIRNVSLRSAAAQAHRIDGLAIVPPTRKVAVFRQTLLPLVLDALGAPGNRSEWGDRFDRGRFDSDAIDNYLELHRDRFNLFDSVAPFAQVAALRTANDEVKPSSLLVPSEPTGNNVPLFGSRTASHGLRLSWMEAAIWLLHAHCWDTAAIKSGAVGDPRVKGGKTTGNRTGPLGSLGIVIPTGRNLFETILLNLPIAEPDPRLGADASADRPQWRRPPAEAEWSERPADGILDLLTWQARRIRLVPTIDEKTGETVVEHVILAAGDRLVSTPDYEPHTTWILSSPNGGAGVVLRPRRHRSGRAAWRGLDALLGKASSVGDTLVRTTILLGQIGALQSEGALEDSYPLGVEIVGTEYGNQSAVVENVIHDAIPMPVRALSGDVDVADAIEEVASDTDALARAVDLLEGDLRRAQGGHLVPWDKGERASARLIQILDDPARRVLAILRDRPDQIEEVLYAWRSSARRSALDVADEVLSAVPPVAVVGRKTKEGKLYRAAVAELRFGAELRKLWPGMEHDVDLDDERKER